MSSRHLKPALDRGGWVCNLYWSVQTKCKMQEQILYFSAVLCHSKCLSFYILAPQTQKQTRSNENDIVIDILCTLITNDLHYTHEDEAFTDG